MEQEVLSVETVKPETAVVPHYNFGSVQVRKPDDVIALASNMATQLASIIKEKHLYTMIGKKAHVNVEAWITAGALLGIVPIHRPDLSIKYDDGGYEETVELLRVLDNVKIGSGTAICGTADDYTWAKRPAFQRKSMAITRATGKAFRLSLSWIMILAGYAGTPAEEMDGIEEHEPEPPRKSEPPKKAEPQKPIQAANEKPQPVQAQPVNGHINQQRWLDLLARARETKNNEGEFFGSSNLFKYAQTTYKIAKGSDLTEDQAKELDALLSDYAKPAPMTMDDMVNEVEATK